MGYVWEQRKVSEISTSFSGGTPRAGVKQYYNGKIPFIRSGEINSPKTEVYITDSGLKNSSAKMAQKGDILYALYGSTSGEVGISKINGAINQAILDIRPNYSNAKFLSLWLSSQKQMIVATYLQGGQGNLSAGIIKNLKIKLPLNLNEQTKISSSVMMVEDLIASNQLQLN